MSIVAARVIVDRAIYRDGKRTDAPDSWRTERGLPRRGGLAWIGLFRPVDEEFAAIAREFELHELAVEDAVKAHQRPKLERYGDMLFLVLRPARYVDETETVEFGEVHVFAGPQFVITVRHGEAPDLAPRSPAAWRRVPSCSAAGRSRSSTPSSTTSSTATRRSSPVSRTTSTRSRMTSSTASPTVSRRIYELAREVVEFQRADQAAAAILAG